MLPLPCLACAPSELPAVPPPCPVACPRQAHDLDGVAKAEACPGALSHDRAQQAGKAWMAHVATSAATLGGRLLCALAGRLPCRGLSCGVVWWASAVDWFDVG
mmetsp:Transcript_14122/g.22456  ORF Transcript_14122/g.22456 Transcript_14122/m.22456 type:complete len:103 (-) Transcript_14122:223-531(-)